jgi:asparagine synthase (glutamine-hydrolysing)
MHPVDRALVSRMTAVLAHRGPDAETQHVGAGVALGHRRLSIIDVAGGHQPIFNEDRTVAVILNGEIYNFQELRTELETRGHRFATRSDTEVIVHGYEEWGESCVARLRGMFAFALWDQPSRTLLLARDRVGKKPLYYACDGERLVFASELKALLQDDALKREIDLEAIDDYLSLGAIPAPRSIFRGVRQLPPAHYLVFRNSAMRLTEYWHVPAGPILHRTEHDTLQAFPTCSLARCEGAWSATFRWGPSERWRRLQRGGRHDGSGFHRPCGYDVGWLYRTRLHRGASRSRRRHGAGL